MEGEGLERFVVAQAAVYDRALAELRRGRKESHWMWFTFPQAAGLGHSPMARRYAIGSTDEAVRYLAHPVLGPRLIECTQAALTHRDTPAHLIFGGIDALKFRSSMTLFAVAAGEPLFTEALEAFYDGVPDPETLRLLG